MGLFKCPSIFGHDSGRETQSETEAKSVGDCFLHIQLRLLHLPGTHEDCSSYVCTNPEPWLECEMRSPPRLRFMTRYHTYRLLPEARKPSLVPFQP